LNTNWVSVFKIIFFPVGKWYFANWQQSGICGQIPPEFYEFWQKTAPAPGLTGMVMVFLFPCNSLGIGQLGFHRSMAGVPMYINDGKGAVATLQNSDSIYSRVPGPARGVEEETRDGHRRREADPAEGNN
jgi:hypothetical protein